MIELQKGGVLEIHGTATKFGGASNGTKILVEEFLKSGLDVYLCCNEKNEVLNKLDKPINKLTLPFSSRNPFIMLKNLFLISQLIRNNNIGVIHSHHRNDNVYACILKIFHPRLKIVYTAHGPQIVHEEKGIFYKVIRSLNFQLINKMVDTVVYISRYTRVNVEEYYSKVKNHLIIYNGTSMPSVTRSSIEIRNEIGISDEDKMVSIIGDIGGFKRPEIAVEIATMLKKYEDIKFVFIGDGARKEEIRKLAIERKLNVFFVDTTPEIGSYINSSDLIISTALEEGFGRTIIEGMALKKPVIAFNSGGPKEIILNNKTGYLIEKGELMDYGKKVKDILEDRKMYLEFGAAGYNRYINLFTERIYSMNYLNLINNSVVGNEVNEFKL